MRRTFVTGVTVVTTMDHDVPRGLAINAFCAVSLAPPIVLVCLRKSSTTHEPLWRSSHLGISILAQDQLPVGKVFASNGSDKFAGLSWTSAPNGSPLITDSSAAVEVEIGERMEAHSHTVFTGRIVHATYTETEPLIYNAGQVLSVADLAEA